MQQRIRTLPWLAALTALLAAFAASALAAANAHAIDPVTGRRRALVVVVQWGDQYENIPASTPRYTREELAEPIDDIVNPWFQSVSRGVFQGWDVDVAGPFTIDPRDFTYPNAHCRNLDPQGAIEWRTRLAAENVGFDYDGYDNVLIYNEPPADCGWDSRAVQNSRLTFMRESFTPGKTISALGKNLGLSDRGSLVCRDEQGLQVTLSNRCSTPGYGDPWSVDWWDASPSGRRPSFPASQQWALGWMGQRKLDLTIGDQPAHLFLQPLESTGLTIQALRIEEPDATYWLEYRADLGVDATPPGGQELTGVLIRRQGFEYPERSILLDMNITEPEPWPNGVVDFRDADLLPGQTWVNPHGHLKFTVNSIGPLGAELTIERKYAPVPDVIGMRRGEAATALSSAGYVVGRTVFQVDATCDYIDRVKGQTPGAGRRLPPGTAIDLTVGTRPAGGCG